MQNLDKKNITNLVHKLIMTINILLLASLLWLPASVLSCSRVSKYSLVQNEESKKGEYHHRHCPYICQSKENTTLGEQECTCKYPQQQKMVNDSGARIKQYKVEHYNSITCNTDNQQDQPRNTGHSNIASTAASKQSLTTILNSNNATENIIPNQKIEGTDYILIIGSKTEVIFLNNDNKTSDCVPQKRLYFPFSALTVRGASSMNFLNMPIMCGGHFWYRLSKEDRKKQGIKNIEVCYMWKSGEPMFSIYANLSRSLSYGHIFSINKTTFGIAGGRTPRGDSKERPIEVDSVDIYHKDGKFNLHEKKLPWPGGLGFCSAYTDEHDYVYFIGGNKKKKGFFKLNKKDLESNILPSQPFMEEDNKGVACDLFNSHETNNLKLILTLLLTNGEISTMILDLGTNNWSPLKDLNIQNVLPKFLKFGSKLLVMEPKRGSFKELTLEPFEVIDRKENLYQSKKEMNQPIFVSKNRAELICLNE